MADRQTFNGASTEVPWADGVGEGLGNQYARHVKALYTAARFPLTAVAGVNDLTATLDPELDGDGLQDGMRFGLTAVAVNTAGMTLAINGGAAVPILTSDLGAIVPGQVQIGARLSLEYVGGNFLVTGVLSGEGGGSYYEVITASTTWTRPAGFDDDRMANIELWGAGGGGGDGRGGGGGGYKLLRIRLGDLPASVPVSIGAGGVAGSSPTDGGDTTFGGLATAYGGAKGGGSLSGSFRGYGGGSHQAGIDGGAIGGGSAGGGSAGGDATTESGGGGGAQGTSAYAGGRAVNGGGGGGLGSGGGGVSINAGNGGSGTTAPTAPAGGGGGVVSGGSTGNTTAGARGQVRVTI